MPMSVPPHTRPHPTTRTMGAGTHIPASVTPKPGGGGTGWAPWIPSAGAEGARAG